MMYGELLDTSATEQQQHAANKYLRHAWGVTDETLPAWQRGLASLLWPLLKAMIRKVRALLYVRERHSRLAAL